MTLTRKQLLDDLRQFAFAPSAFGESRRIGAEVELIPVDAVTRRPTPIIPRPDRDEVASLPVLRSVAQHHGWREECSAKAGVPEFRTPNGGRITFEPGGQVEFSAAPASSLTQLASSLGEVVVAIRAAMADAGIDTLTLGVDPVNRIEDVPLQLGADRYRRMEAHFASIGPHGARMMRQTASIQVCLDSGPTPLERWRLLNALAPYVVAIFANSPVYEGLPTGHQSTRRGIWGALDPARTGIPLGGDAVESYADFACNASAILIGDETVPFASFRDHMDDPAVGIDEWRTHLSTLFPEVRPRGYFEVRSCDALSPAWYLAPLVFLTGLAYGPDGGRQALEIAGAPNAASLERAGRCGLDDPALATRAIDLCALALSQCSALGPDFVSGGVLERATDFFDRFTRARRAPARELLTLAVA